MASFDTESAYPSEAAYWTLVERTLVDVFDQNPNDARAKVDALERQQALRPREDQLLGFHAEPLSVAARAANRVLTETEVQQYLTLARQAGWAQSVDENSAGTSPSGRRTAP